MGIISKELLSLETGFGKLCPRGSIHEHQFFIKRKSLFIKQYSQMLLIFSCIIQHAKSAKETWDNFYATFEELHVGDSLQLYQ